MQYKQSSIINFTSEKKPLRTKSENYGNRGPKKKRQHVVFIQCFQKGENTYKADVVRDRGLCFLVSANGQTLIRTGFGCNSTMTICQLPSETLQLSILQDTQHCYLSSSCVLYCLSLYALENLGEAELDIYSLTTNSACILLYIHSGKKKK